MILRKTCIWLCLLALGTAMAPAQVTLVSPEEGRKAMKSIKEAPHQAAPAAPAAQPAAKKPLRGRMLPDGFSGWQGAGLQKFGPYNANTFAGDDGPVLLEYGYEEAERREFHRDGRTLKVEAVRLSDAFGSYGLFTLYRGEGWSSRLSGSDQIAARNGEFVIRKDEVVVRGSAEGALSDEELNELLASLESRGGGSLPTLPAYLPAKGLVPQSPKFVLGPAGLARVAPDLPAALIEFEYEPQVNIARYQLPNEGGLSLVLTSYPTSQMARGKLKQIEESGVIRGTTKSTVFARNIGPLLAFVVGARDRGQADRLLDRITYTAQLTWNEPVEKMDAPTFARFLLNVFILVAILFGFAIVAGLGFGVLRFLLSKWYPGQFFDRPEETEVIRLNINYSK